MAEKLGSGMLILVLAAVLVLTGMMVMWNMSLSQGMHTMAEAILRQQAVLNEVTSQLGIDDSQVEQPNQRIVLRKD